MLTLLKVASVREGAAGPLDDGVRGKVARAYALLHGLGLDQLSQEATNEGVTCSGHKYS
jgi:hypothetical protein